jgi:hypothetical protein
MAKNKISEFSSTPANNTDIGGINIAEGCAPSGINNAIRELMAQLKDQQAGTDSDNFTVGGGFTCAGAAVFSSTVAIATALPVTSGGTGVSSVTTGDILYASGSNTLAKLAGAATTGQVLLSGVSAPSWGKVPMSSHVTGTLPVANGGTGASTLTSKAVVIGNGTSAVSGVAPSTSGNVLASNGTDWASTALSSLAVFDKSLSANGYQKLPGGLIIQWGSFTSNVDDEQTVTFPITFPTACYAVTSTISGIVANVSTSSFTVNRINDIYDSSLTGYFIAVGS